jgi:hypothetical protein
MTKNEYIKKTHETEVTVDPTNWSKSDKPFKRANIFYKKLIYF